MIIEGYLLSYRINGNGNVWMLRFDTDEQAKAHVRKVGLDTPCYQHVINAIVSIPTITVTEGV
jgi:hypothetical protein